MSFRTFRLDTRKSMRHWIDASRTLDRRKFVRFLPSGNVGGIRLCARCLASPPSQPHAFAATIPKPRQVAS